MLLAADVKPRAAADTMVPPAGGGHAVGTCAWTSRVVSWTHPVCWARDGRLLPRCRRADGAGTYQAGAGERVNIVWGWVYASLAARRHAGGLDIDAPVLANVWARLADGYASFEACRCRGPTGRAAPPPQPYTNWQHRSRRCSCQHSLPQMTASRVVPQSLRSDGQLSGAAPQCHADLRSALHRQGSEPDLT